MTTESARPETADPAQSLMEREAKFFFQAARRVPVVIERGEGTVVFDPAGKRYLDFVAGIATTSIGHANPVLVDAVTNQVKKLVHISNIYFSEPQIQLAELLVEHSVFDRAWFCNSGAEANEAAIKLARKWGGLYKDGAFEVITTENSFHGRTLVTITASGTDRYKDPFRPLPPGFNVVPWNDLGALAAAITPKTCAIMLEPVQGEGGVNLPDDGYLQGARKLCDEQNVLLIFDEIQTGVGRTGTLWAYERFGVEPEVMTLAKGLAGGVPIGAILAKEPVASAFVPGDHGSTFGGNPLATAAGYAVLKYIIDAGIPAEVERKGELLRQKLHGIEDRHHEVTEVRGLGLLNAVQFDTDIAAEVMGKCLEGGLVVNLVRPNLLRLMPPLTVTDAELEEAAQIFEAAIAERAASK